MILVTTASALINLIEISIVNKVAPRLAFKTLSRLHKLGVSLKSWVDKSIHLLEVFPVHLAWCKYAEHVIPKLSPCVLIIFNTVHILYKPFHKTWCKPTNETLVLACMSLNSLAPWLCLAHFPAAGFTSPRLVNVIYVSFAIAASMYPWLALGTKHDRVWILGCVVET